MQLDNGTWPRQRASTQRYYRRAGMVGVMLVMLVLSEVCGGVQGGLNKRLKQQLKRQRGRHERDNPSTTDEGGGTSDRSKSRRHTRHSTIKHKKDKKHHKSQHSHADHHVPKTQDHGHDKYTHDDAKKVHHKPTRSDDLRGHLTKPRDIPETPGTSANTDTTEERGDSVPPDPRSENRMDQLARELREKRRAQRPGAVCASDGQQTKTSSSFNKESGYGSVPLRDAADGTVSRKVADDSSKDGETNLQLHSHVTFYVVYFALAIISVWSRFVTGKGAQGPDVATIEQLEQRRREVCKRITSRDEDRPRREASRRDNDEGADGADDPAESESESDSVGEAEVSENELDELLDGWDPEFDLGGPLHDLDALNRYTEGEGLPPLLSGVDEVQGILSGELDRRATQRAIESVVQREMSRVRRGSQDADSVLEMARQFDALHAIKAEDKTRLALAGNQPGEGDVEWVMVDPLCLIVSASAHHPENQGPSGDGGDASSASADTDGGADRSTKRGAPPPNYTDASVLPAYCEEVVLGVVRDNGDDSLVDRLRIPVQEMIEGQVRLTKRHQGEVEQVSERLVHEAAVRQTDLQLEITAADRRHDTRTDELRTRQTRGIDRLKIQIQEILSKQQEKLLVDLDYVYNLERERHFNRLYFRGSATVCICAVSVILSLMSELFGSSAELDGAMSFREDLLIFAKCSVASLAAGFHTALGRIAGNAGFIASGVLALGVLMATKFDQFLSMWVQSHFLLLALVLPAFWCGLMLHLTTKAYARRRAAIEANEWSLAVVGDDRTFLLESTFAWPAVGGVDVKLLVDDFAVPTLQYLLVLFGACRVACQCHCLDLLFS